MTAPIEEVMKTTFDYVIVGGGTAGLALAVRLSADHSASVIVLEAGEAHDDDDPIITAPGQFGVALGMPKYSDTFLTVPQPHVNGRQMPWVRGKGLGGSSLVNFQGWFTPPSQDLDAIEALGNPGWGWNDYAKYQARTFTQVKTAPPHHSEVLDRMFFDTLANLGIEENLDPYNGNILGVSLVLANLDPKTWTRSSSTAAYYHPIKDRLNLAVVTSATVARILFDSSAGGDLTAIGTEFIHNGKTYVARVKKEVILSAGAIGSPQLLELSGIGRRDVIDKIGVELNVELPGVGENVQEHLALGVLYETDPEKSFETFECLQDPDYVEERQKCFAEGKGTLSVHARSVAYLPLSTVNLEGTAEIVKKIEQEVEALKRSGTLPPGLADQYDIQLNTLRDPEAADCEVILHPGYLPPAFEVPLEPGKRYVTILYVGNHLFSRGSIHAKSSDPNDHPEIDPRYLSFDYDLELIKQHMAFGRKVVEQQPFKSAILKQIHPKPGTSDDDHIKEASGSIMHTMGSCSMMPREKNGVVSPELLVYGTKNLRVVDISIMPLQLATHAQSVAYAIAEKAADLILGM